MSVTTIRRAELTEGETSMTTANDLAVRRALENAGVEFIDENGGGPGVRLRRARSLAENSTARTIHVPGEKSDHVRGREPQAALRRLQTAPASVPPASARRCGSAR